MREKQLSIDIERGNWLVDVIDEHIDDGIYELVSPVRSTTLHLHEDHIYGFQYSIVGKKNSPFTIKLNDEVLAEGRIGESGIKRGRGIL